VSEFPCDLSSSVGGDDSLSPVWGGITRGIWLTPGWSGGRFGFPFFFSFAGVTLRGASLVGGPFGGIVGAVLVWAIWARFLFQSLGSADVGVGGEGDAAWSCWSGTRSVMRAISSTEPAININLPTSSFIICCFNITSTRPSALIFSSSPIIWMTGVKSLPIGGASIRRPIWTAIALAVAMISEFCFEDSALIASLGRIEAIILDAAA
jgi:hypothetical protein